MQKPIALKFAPTWKRIVAYLIDVLIVGLVTSMMIGFALYQEFDANYESLLSSVSVGEINQEKSFTDEISGIEMNLESEADILAYAVSQTIFSRYTLISVVEMLIQVAYFTLFFAGTGRTIGAGLLKITVMTLDGRKLKPLMALFRAGLLLLFANLFYLPLLLIVNPIFRQRLHDVLTRSVVVEIPDLPEASGKTENETALEE